MNDEPNDALVILSALKTALALVEAGILTADEMRVLIGLPPRETA